MRKRPNPFSSWPELYATGDRARVAADGTLEFEGRSDDLVKVHGVRVGLGEIEEALRSHSAVRDAAVVAALDAEGPEDDQALRRHLRAHYPDHLVPHAIAWIPRLPRTASGKADRPALKASITDGALLVSPASGSAAGAADVEGVVREAWLQALGGGPEEGDFFELGGDSMQVIAMLGRVTTALGVDIPLIAAFFGDPTLRGLVRVIREGMAVPAKPLVGRPRIPAKPGPAAT
jgi:hypothetical protein